MLLYDIFNGVVRCEITAPFEYQLSDVDALFIKQLCCCCGNMVSYKLQFLIETDFSDDTNRIKHKWYG